MKKVYLLFCLLITTDVFASYGGNIGISDDRTYGSMEDPLYSAVAKFISSKGGCTAGFIDKNLVITNRHCAILCQRNDKPCYIKFWNGREYVQTSATTIMLPREHTNLDGNDWAIMRTDDINPNFKKLAQKSTTGQISRGGFGGMRVIKDSELPTLKEIYIQTERKYRTECQQNKESAYSDCIFKHFNEAVKDNNMQPIMGDQEKFKVQTCNITGDKMGHPRMVQTDCDSSGGDSGAPLIRGNTIVGLNNSGPHTFIQDNESNGANAVKNENFYTYAQKKIQKTSNNSGNSGGQHTNNNSNNNTTPNNNNSNSNNNSNNNGNTGNNNTGTTNNNANNNNNNVITDQEQIRKIIEQEIMNLECD